MTRPLLSAVLLALAALCATAEQRTETLTHGGLTRTYHVRLPRAFDRSKPHPLLLALHGGGGQGLRFDRSTSGTLGAAADARGVLLVFPEGVAKQWNDGRTEHLKGKQGADDVGFLSKLIEVMQRRYGADPTRVYATGISNGGFMSIRLAIELSHKLAAVAPVTAQLSRALDGRLPKQPISIMIVNGTRDPLVPYGGGHVRLFRLGRSRGRIFSTAETVRRFVAHNGCEKKPKVRQLPDTVKADGCRARVETHGGGRAGSEVVLVTVTGGGHTWPGGTQYLPRRLIGPVCRDFKASELILDFLLKHSRKE